MAELTIDVARNLYSSGLSIDEVAGRLGKCRNTINNYRKKDAEKGVDWERLRLRQYMGDKEFENKHRVFLFAMFDAFEKDLPRLSQIDNPTQRLEILDKYSNTYYKLMNAAKREQPEIAIAEIAGKTLECVAKLALKSDARDVIRFLDERLEEIKAMIVDDLK